MIINFKEEYNNDNSREIYNCRFGDNKRHKNCVHIVNLIIKKKIH